MATGTVVDKTRPTSPGRRLLFTALAACLLGTGSAGAAEITPGWKKRCLDATAAPVTVGANWQLSASAPDAIGSADQIEVAKFEINNSCGVRLGRMGVPLAVDVRDNQNNLAQSVAVTQALIQAGAVAVVGGGNSINAPPSAQVAVQSNIPFGANQAAADTLSGCTAAELADPAITKSMTPVYGPAQCWDHHGLVFRTTATGYQWGTVGARYARETHPTLTTAAILFRNDDFGRPNRDGFRSAFAELGGTVLAEVPFVGQAVTVDQFKGLLRTATAGNPSIIAVNPNTTLLKRLMQAYVELRDDPTWTAKPVNFSTLRFLSISTATGDTYLDLTPPALAALVNQFESVQPAWDPSSVAFQRWFTLYQTVYPNAQPPTSGFYMSAYDAVIVMALAITAAGTTDGAAIAAKLREVTNPPGVCVYPGEWRKAFRLLAKGKDINYEGALGSVDLDERGNATGIAYGIFNVQPDGSPTLLRTFQPAAQQSACEADDDVEDDNDE
jgi:ABC-type branched-subunit amino acid transport system substrate-binding protein